MEEKKEKKFNNVHEFEIKIDGKEWETCLDNSFKRNNKEKKIDGFRKGTAPKDIYLKNFGIESLYPDAVNEALNIAYKKVLEENKIIPVTEPIIDVTGISDGSVIFKIVIITDPIVKLGEYKNLGIKCEKAKVTKKEIDEEISEIKKEYADVVLKENGEVADGDTVVIDFDGYVDNEPLEGGKGENYPLEIGSNTFIPGFESGLVGHKTGEELELNLKFPENYVDNLKNKDVLFKVKINEIKTKVEPEIGEELYKDLGFDDIKTKEEFENKIKEQIMERKQAELDDKFVEEILDKASSNMEIELNDELIDGEVHRMIEQYENQLKMQGLSIEQYYEFTHTTHEDLHKQMEGEAIKRLKYRYLIETVAKEENISFTDKEVDEKTKEMAANYGISEEELIKAYGSKEVVKYDMKMHKALEILRDSNK